MSEWLVIRLGSRGGAAAGFLLRDAADGKIGTPRVASYEQIAALAPGRRICVLVPASEVLTLDAELPAGARSKMLQAVPFAVEEQLADNVEDLHFAIGERDDLGRTPVAAVARATLGAWLSGLRGAGLEPDAVYADAALLPSNPGQIVVLIEHDSALIRAPGSPAVSLPVEQIGESVQLARDSAASDATQLGLIVYATEQDWRAREAAIDGLRPTFAGVRVQLLPQGALPLLAEQLPRSDAINLLQGAFAPRAASGANWRAWRVAAALAALLVFAAAGTNLWELRRLRGAERQLDAEIAELVRGIAPQSGNVRGARRAIEQLLARISAGQADTAGLLPALSAFAQARAPVADAVIEQLSYKPGQLDLRVRASGAEHLEQINNALRAAGWRAELKSGAARDSAYEGRIELRAAGS
jgi:general secretion pathway protein L